MPPQCEKKKKKKTKMEKVVLATSDLNQLARHHPTLAPHFVATLPCDLLPPAKTLSKPCGLIVNTDTADLPGRHWLGLWVPAANRCEILDSFGLDLDVYETTAPLKRWLKQFKYVSQSGRSLQSVADQSCGDYALMYLVARSQDQTLSDFLKFFSKHDYVSNDRRVGRWLEQLIKDERKWQHEAALPEEFVDGGVPSWPVVEQSTPRSRQGVRHLLR